MLSIIIPTYNEGENVIIISQEIQSSMNMYDYEIVFVDDSKDNTVDILNKLKESNGKIRYYHRNNERGLATAVILGFKMAKGDIIAVMDADLQHNPIILREMINAINNGADIAIPSRFVEGGDDGGLDNVRKFVSYVARKIGQISIKKLRDFSDITSGYFMFRKEVINNCDLDPIGWKILMEILVKGKYDKVVEIPYQFESRKAGESKMSLKEQWNYLRHVARLLLNSPSDIRFILFCMVGVSGVIINLIIYMVLVNMGFSIISSAIFSALIAMISNFILNDLFTWRDIKKTKLNERMSKNFITSIIGIIINVFILNILKLYSQINYIIANTFSIMLSTVWNYFVNKSWTWRRHSK